METRSKRNRIGPLPGGDRRGTPGADAGCLSMRTVSGEELSRRAPTDKDTTADPFDEIDRLTDRTNSPIEPFSPSTVSYTPSLSSSPISNTAIPTPTLNVAREVNTFLPASTKAGKPRVRMRWSKEVNLFIMRTYYYITKLETDMTIYRKLLHELFSQKYPEINVSEQRISDQRRTIVRNKLIPQVELDRLKEEVRAQLEENTNANTLSDVQNQDVNVFSHDPFSQHLINTQTQNNLATDIGTQTESLTITIENDIHTLAEPDPLPDSWTANILEKFRTTLVLYSGMDPESRPRLPKLKYSPKLVQLVSVFNNNILGNIISEDTQLIDLNTIIYCTALAISEELGYKITDYLGNTRSKHHNKPAWQVRLERDIEKLRADCGRLTQFINNNRSRKVIKRVEAIFKSRITHTRHEDNNRKPEEFLDTLKQKLALKVHRLKRYKKAQQRKNDNIVFSNNEKMFYRNLLKPQAETISQSNLELPTKESLETFWSRIWEEQVQYNENAEWINEEEAKWLAIEEMSFAEVTETDVLNVTSRLHNWKSPGVDKIHNYWYKKLVSIHGSLAKNLTDIVLGKQIIPDFLATGVTYMLPKGKHSAEPSQYRPITCLPTVYKILTSVITLKINSHIEQHNIIAEEQKGCRRNHMGCKEQLIIDSVIHKHASTKSRNLHCTYIDYQKAFDSIPHSWLIKILQIYRINFKLIEFLSSIMTRWKTTLQLNYNRDTIISRQISIRKGIYQGDSLSPLWFCLALNPLSSMLHRSRVGYCLRHDTHDVVISHLIYMDDIKLYSKSETDMKKLIDTTTLFSKDINMQFGLDKCNTTYCKRQDQTR
ncbi:uncharacterized protein LOC113500810 [Trichoplusia ni]|uniref:Uncharacterized protein LOC113500810 n=1 Tax=Trichoplusia ni TaxID=7111 RepID=A0A7E5WA37_TRINI|nr:uncharacterized protein LOC113500810 [Trichoplusia ni]